MIVFCIYIKYNIINEKVEESLIVCRKNSLVLNLNKNLNKS